MSRQVLYKRTVGDLLAAEFVREDDGAVTLTVNTEVRLTNELIRRPKETQTPSTDVPNTAVQLMDAIIEQLTNSGITVENPAAHTDTDENVTLTTTVDTAGRPDEELRALFEQAVSDAVDNVSVNRFGKTSDRQGGKLAGR